MAVCSLLWNLFWKKLSTFSLKQNLLLNKSISNANQIQCIIFANITIVWPIHNLRTLVHSRCKWHSAEKRHAVGEDTSADETCIPGMCEQTIHTNNKLKFLTTKTLQRKNRYIYVRAYVCGTMCWHVSFLLYWNNSAESCRLRQLSEFHPQSLPGVDTLPRILELCRLTGYVLCCSL